jgi:hypothetical protein
MILVLFMTFPLWWSDPIRTRTKGQSAAQEKAPRRERRGLNLFFSKEVTAISITGDRVFLIVIGFGSSYFYSYFSSGV